jgi:hypothetical protein
MSININIFFKKKFYEHKKPIFILIEYSITGILYYYTLCIYANIHFVFILMEDSRASHRLLQPWLLAQARFRV